MDEVPRSSDHTETKRAIAILGVLVLLGIGYYLYTQNIDTFEPEGVLVASGHLYEWEVINGRAYATIEDEEGNRWKYSFYVDDQVKFVKFLYKDDDPTQKRKVKEGTISEIEGSNNVSIYLEAPYQDVRRIAKMVAYWD